MVSSCCAYGCRERQVRGGPVTFHCFPKDPFRSRQWAARVRRLDFIVSKHTKICSKHFRDDCFATDKFGGTWLKKDALPTLFDFSPQVKTNVGRPPKKKLAIEELPKLNGTKEEDSRQPKNKTSRKKRTVATNSRSRNKRCIEQAAIASSSGQDPPTPVAEATPQLFVEAKPQSFTEAPPPPFTEATPPPVHRPPIVATPLFESPPEVTAVPEYVFQGKRLVNMGFFIKSLQKLNEHNRMQCSFSDMKVCAETAEGWNVGIVFKCMVCSLTAVVWMEDPDTKVPSTSRDVPAPGVVLPGNSVLKKWGPRRRYQRKTPTPHPDPPSRHFQQSPTKQYGRTRRKNPTPPPDTPTMHCPEPQILSRMVSSLLVDPPLIGEPQVPPYIKQEAISPGKSTIPSSYTERTTVQMTFCEEPLQSSSDSVDPSALTATESAIVTPDVFVHNQTVTTSGSSNSALSETITPDVLSVDLNLVKKEVDADEPCCRVPSDKGTAFAFVPKTEAFDLTGDCRFTSHKQFASTELPIPKTSSFESDIEMRSVVDQEHVMHQVISGSSKDVLKETAETNNKTHTYQNNSSGQIKYP